MLCPSCKTEHKPIFEKNDVGDVIHFHGWGGEMWFKYDYTNYWHIKIECKSTSTNKTEIGYKNK